MKTTFQIVLKSLLVGVGYAVMLALTHLLPSRDADAQSLFWSFTGAVAMGLARGPLTSAMPASQMFNTLMWRSIVFFDIISVTIEGRFFTPDLLKGSMVVIILQQLLVALVVTWLIIKFFAPIGESAPRPASQRLWFSWLWRYIVSALSYIFFYYFFGAINYLLVTGLYYEIHAGWSSLHRRPSSKPN